MAVRKHVDKRREERLQDRVDQLVAENGLPAEVALCGVCPVCLAGSPSCSSSGPGDTEVSPTYEPPRSEANS